MKSKKIRDYGIEIGKFKTGLRNQITDVDGVKVGHVTLDDGKIKTGVTALIPHEGNIFKEKLKAGLFVLNGFGKTMGLVQIEELGTIETPLILTNTLSIGTCANGLIGYMLRENRDIGDTTGTVNPLVCECNDGFLNDIRGRHVRESHVISAIDNADMEFAEGNVGAGTGMSCFGLKGGIGSSSRIVEICEKEYTVGALVLSNFGKCKDLEVNGKNIGFEINSILKEEEQREKGSIIVIIATDAPLSARQLKRLSKRGGAGIVRTGSHLGNGSGDIIISFSTANKIKHYEENAEICVNIFNDDKIDKLFHCAVESVEEAILNSMICSDDVVGRDGNKRYSLKAFIDLYFK